MSKYAPHRKSASQPRATSSTICQKCLGTGHFIYDCKSTRPYITRPSRTKMLENPKLLAKLKAEGKPSVEVPEEFKSKSGTANRILEGKEHERERAKSESSANKGEGSSKKRRRSTSASSSSDSDSDSDSDSSSDSGSSSSGSESDGSRSRKSYSKSPARKRRYRSESRSRSRSPRR